MRLALAAFLAVALSSATSSVPAFAYGGCGAGGYYGGGCHQSDCSYDWHRAGWWRGRYFPAGYYRWTSAGWHLRGYGLHPGFPSYNGVLVQQVPVLPLGPAPAVAGGVTVPGVPQAVPAMPPAGVNMGGLTSQDLQILKEFVEHVKRQPAPAAHPQPPPAAAPAPPPMPPAQDNGPAIRPASETQPAR